jgi:hypothetical protein
MEKTKTLDELQAETDIALKAYREVQKRYQDRVYELETEARKKARIEFHDDIVASTEILNKYQKALEAEKHRIWLENAANSLPYPEGTKLFKWAPQTTWGRIIPFVKTKETGVLQIFRKGDEYPLNKRHSMPSVGSLIVRFPKKDGTLGKDFEAFRKDFWLPEGVDHPKAIKKEIA